MARTPWKQNLLKYEELVQLATSEEKKFRTGISMLPASSIANQLFCEMKVEQNFLQGEVETEAKTEGTELHEELLAMEKSTIQKIIKGIESEKVFTASMPLVARSEGLALIGVPDAVVFRKGKPRHIIELKTTAKGDATRIYDSQKAQAMIYGLLLEEMGFDCSNLDLVIVRYRTSALLTEKDKSEFLGYLVRALNSGMSRAIAIKSKREIVPHILRYERQYAIQVLNKTKGYWLNEREPVPTTNEYKCRACEFARTCPSSLAIK